MKLDNDAEPTTATATPDAESTPTEAPLDFANAGRLLDDAKSGKRASSRAPDSKAAAGKAKDEDDDDDESEDDDTESPDGDGSDDTGEDEGDDEGADKGAPPESDDDDLEPDLTSSNEDLEDMSEQELRDLAARQRAGVEKLQRRAAENRETVETAHAMLEIAEQFADKSTMADALHRTIGTLTKMHGPDAVAEALDTISQGALQAGPVPKPSEKQVKQFVADLGFETTEDDEAAEKAILAWFEQHVVADDDSGEDDEGAAPSSDEDRVRADERKRVLAELQPQLDEMKKLQAQLLAGKAATDADKAVTRAWHAVKDALADSHPGFRVKREDVAAAIKAHGDSIKNPVAAFLFHHDKRLRAHLAKVAAYGSPPADDDMIRSGQRATVARENLPPVDDFASAGKLLERYGQKRR